MQSIQRFLISLKPTSRRTLLLALLPAPIFLVLAFAYPGVLPPLLLIPLVASVLAINLWVLRTPCHTCNKQEILTQFPRRANRPDGVECDPTMCMRTRARDEQDFSPQ